MRAQYYAHMAHLGSTTFGCLGCASVPCVSLRECAKFSLTTIIPCRCSRIISCVCTTLEFVCVCVCLLVHAPHAATHLSYRLSNWCVDLSRRRTNRRTNEIYERTLKYCFTQCLRLFRLHVLYVYANALELVILQNMCIYSTRQKRTSATHADMRTYV